MSLSFSSSVSGVRVASDMLAVSALNTAHLDTDGFKKQRVDLREDSHGGVIADISESTEAGSRYRNADGDMVEASNVDYAEEAIVQINAKHFLSANIAAIKRIDEAQKSLMDIIA
jgi:flagellar basal-body rod protein FlgC